MKKTSRKGTNELRTEYKRSDLGRLTRGKYAQRVADATNVVVLDPRLAKEFPNDRAVNKALRGLLRKLNAGSSGGSGAPKKIRRCTSGKSGELRNSGSTLYPTIESERSCTKPRIFDLIAEPSRATIATRVRNAALVGSSPARRDHPNGCAEAGPIPALNPWAAAGAGRRLFARRQLGYPFTNGPNTRDFTGRGP